MTAQEYLQEIRARGFTQAEVAHQTGITQGTISKIESGEARNALASTYLALQSMYQRVKRKPKAVKA